MTVLDAPRNGARRHPAFVVAVGGLEHRVDAERRAMCEQRRLLIGVKRAERRPQPGRSVGQTVGPDPVTFVDPARATAVINAGRVDAKADGRKSVVEGKNESEKVNT